ncbi:ATP-binding protein [Psychrobacter sanguinis]|uniref:ATP-binding protein n=1 Tax=Psychrobacter sanguinis TaxID=861445 RepID=UPI001919AA8D|nr:ATP-binding protein [Psychrobacter sanguinis]MCC3345084.1 ATP-binding protein [Psychrobacter sanguinis]
MANSVNSITLDDTLSHLLAEFLKQNIIPALHIDPNQLAYRWVGGIKGRLEPIKVSSSLALDDLIGIDTQKQKIVQNTKQFLAGYPANHVLMTGTRGAGKSSIVRALLNEFKDQGLRMIEVSRDDLQMLDKIRDAINELPEDTSCRYIVYCDDLAFNGQDENYRTLKSVLDGALDSEQDKILVYATSNRRHLLPQLMKDNVSIYDGQTDEVNPYETIDETVSLSDRFGLWLSFYPMNQETYLNIVGHYLQAEGVEWTDKVRHEALLWSSSRGGRSGRVAYQFARHWMGQQLLNQDSLN